jgi:GTP-binding protein
MLLVDMKVGIMDSDKMLIDMLSEAHKPFVMILTKADKVKESETQKKLDEIANQVRGMGSLCNPFIHATSAV